MYDLFPGVFATVEMIPDSVGVWLLHCHVNDHMTGGMEALYTVHGKYLSGEEHLYDHLRKLSKIMKSSRTRSIHPKVRK